MAKFEQVDSYYAATANPKPDYPKLTESVDCDVCIVGAGITGASTALHLAERGYKVTLLEQAQVGWGASGRNGGQLIAGFAREQIELEKLVGLDDAKKLWQLSLDALDLTKTLIQKHAIACDLQSGYLHVALNTEQWKALQADHAHLAKHYGYDQKLLERRSLREHLASNRYVGGVFDPNSGHLHPLNYVQGLADAAAQAGAQIFENSRVKRLEIMGDRVAAHTSRGQVRATFLVLCGNAYLERLLAPQLVDKMAPVGTYIAVTAPLGEDKASHLIHNNAAVSDANFVLNYFRRTADNRLLFGGGVNYTGGGEPLTLFRSMRGKIRKVFPQLSNTDIDYLWGGNVAITYNRLPHFGRLRKNIYFAHGFSGHGLALTGLAGKLTADAIAGTAENFDIFARIPHKDFPGGKRFRRPALVLGGFYYRLRDML